MSTVLRTKIVRLEAVIGRGLFGPTGAQGPEDCPYGAQGESWTDCLDGAQGSQSGDGESCGVIFEVVNYEADFMLNEIPHMQLTLVVGRSTADLTQVASIHRYAAELRHMVPVQVYFYPEGQFSENDDWPPGPHLIWDGYLAGTGYRQSKTGLLFVAYCTHWLSDLDFSSSMTRWTHPLNSAEYAFQTVHTAPDTGITTLPSLIATTLTTAFVSSERIKEDLWGCTIQPWFCHLATYDTIAMIPAERPLTHGNTSALNALNRMQGICGADTGPQCCGAAAGEYFKPLTLDPATSDANDVACGIADALGSETVQSFQGHTLWDKLIQYANEFVFAVVPMVNTALVVPFIAGFRDPFKTICAGQYMYVDLSAQLQRPLKMCVILGGHALSTGISMTDTGVIEWKLPGGDWSSGGSSGNRAPDKGMILVKNAPGWLANPVCASESAAYATQTNVGSIKTSTTVDDDPGPQGVQAPDATPSEKIAAAQEPGSLLERYAHAMFVEHGLRGRQGVVVTKLRFDIAPGSTIKLQGSGDTHIGGLLDDALNADLWAQVLKVSIYIDREAPRASTILHVAYQRNRGENEDPRTSVAFHPLYGFSDTEIDAGRWPGSPLVEDLDFVDTGDCGSQT